MTVLDQIQQLRQQGMQDTQVIQTLQEQGITPKDINEALSQSEVKAAVAPVAAPTDGFEQSAQPAVDSGTQQPIPQVPVMPDPNAQYANETAYPQEQYPQEGYDPAAYPQEQYPQDQAYQQGGIDIETIRQITKQIIDTELDKTKSKIDDITKLKTELKFQIQNMDNRLAKIESTIEALQSAILGKIGDYGEAVQDISKDLKTTQESFSKLIDPIIDQKRGKPVPRTKKKSSSARDKNSAGFEDYFR